MFLSNKTTIINNNDQIPAESILRKDGRVSIRKTMDPLLFSWDQFFRTVEIKKGTLANSAGSCYVRIGNTTVLCAIQAEITTCKDEEKGHVFFSVDIPSFGGQVLKFNEKNEKQEALKNIITEIFDKSLEKNKLFKKIDSEDEDDLAWVLYVDCLVFQDDGCLLDALIFSISGALSDLKLPEKVFHDQHNYIRCSTEKQSVSLLTYYPIPTTFSLITRKDFNKFFNSETEMKTNSEESSEDTHILIDPLKIEERLSSTTFCVIYKSQKPYSLVQVCRVGDPTDFNASATELDLKDDELIFCLSVAKKKIEKIVNSLSE